MKECCAQNNKRPSANEDDGKELSFTLHHTNNQNRKQTMACLRSRVLL